MFRSKTERQVDIAKAGFNYGTLAIGNEMRRVMVQILKGIREQIAAVVFLSTIMASASAESLHCLIEDYTDPPNPVFVQRLVEEGRECKHVWTRARWEKDGASRNRSMADQAVGPRARPSGYVRLHVEGGVAIRLVPQPSHSATMHLGGFAVIRNGGFGQ